MEERLDKWRSILVACALAALIHVTILFPYVDYLLEPVHERFRVPLRGLQIAAAVLLAGIFHLVLYSRWAYRYWVAF